MARAFPRTRSIARVQADDGWFARLSDAERMWFSKRCVQFVDDLIAYLDAERDQAAAVLSSAERRAGEFGAETARLGASLCDTVGRFIRFRKPFIDELVALSRRRRLDTSEATAILFDAESALDRLLVALMLGYRTGVRPA